MRAGFRQQRDEPRRVDDPDLVGHAFEQREGPVELLAFEDETERFRAGRERVAAAVLAEHDAVSRQAGAGHAVPQLDHSLGTPAWSAGGALHAQAGPVNPRAKMQPAAKPDMNRAMSNDSGSHILGRNQRRHAPAARLGHNLGMGRR